MTTEYMLIETTPSAEDFCRLRKIAGLSARPLAAAEIGLPPFISFGRAHR